MNKLKYLSCLLILLPLSSTAQWVHSAKDQMDSMEWTIIDMIRFNKVNDTTLMPVYSEMVSRYHNEHFQLTGYMIPMKAGMMQSQFMISTLPVNQCYFCGKYGNPIMVMVKAKNPVRFSFKIVTVEGVLNLSRGNAYYLPCATITEASQVN